jgi:hypothetical protein
MKKFILVFTISLWVGFSNTAISQVVTDSTTIWRIITVDGNEFVGTIEKKDATIIVVTSPIYGELELHTAVINKMEPVDQKQFKGGELWPDNPQSSRYFWQPNGYGLKKGEGYFQNNWVFFNQVSYGFSNYFSVGLGMMPLFLLASPATPVWITPKFSVPVVKDVINVGGGALIASAIGEEADPLGLVYGVATFGNRNTNLNFGMGYGFAEGEWGKIPVYTLSGMIRVSRKSYMLMENYLISSDSETVTLISVGGRTVWPKVSVDYGLVIPVYEEMENLVALPWLGFVIPFGNL